MNAPATASTVDIDSILDGTLDDIADLPSFAAWPSGAYRATLKEGFKLKEINGKPAYELKLTNEEVLEISNALEQEEAPKIGDEASLAFGMDSETGRGFFKEAIKPFVEALGLPSGQAGVIRAAVDSSKGLQVMVILKRTKKTVDGEEKKYQHLVKLSLL